MKVKCIRNEGQPWVGNCKKKYPWSSGKFKKNGPSYKDIVTVSREYWNEGARYYNLEEWPNGVGYLSTYFKPIEEQEEKFEAVTFEKIKEEKPISVN